MNPLAERYFAEAEACLDTLRIPEAIDLFHQAERAGFDPDRCAGGRWNGHMLLGDMAAAWHESDRISQGGNPDPNRFWNGQPLDDENVLIRCLHGLGDTLQFIRYARLLRPRVRSLTIEAQPPLRDLLVASGLADHVFTWGEPEPSWTRQVEVMELPRIFRSVEPSIPRVVPYLCVPPAHSPVARTQLYAGILSTASKYNPARSIHPDDLGDLLEVPGVTFYNLPAGPEKSICEVAALLQELDLVITVDTMMAHLAGALARPVWTLLPYRCDWRWMLEREDSPWYPTMRLIRQSQPGNWRPVVETVRTDLQHLVAASVPLSSKSSSRSVARDSFKHLVDAPNQR